MENDIPCPLHPGVTMTARTGQYGTFWSHLVSGVGWCDGKKIKPLKPQGAVQPVPPPVVREPVKEPDWDAIAEGKVRHGVVVAQIQYGGIESLKGKLPAIKKVTSYIMTGDYTED